MENGILDEMFEFLITPGPWSVAPHRDTEGAYIVKEALREQLIWVTEGYDVSVDEGDRRNQIVERRNAGNVRLIQGAPELFEALRNLLLYPDAGKEQAVETLKSIAQNWQTIVAVNRNIRGGGMHERTQRAECVLVEYHRLKREPMECLENSITDLMTDLLHLAHKEDLDGLALARMVQMHFEAEVRQVA